MPQDRLLGDVVRQLTEHGWAFVRYSQNAHAVFEKPGQRPLIVPVKNKKVKACYDSRIRKACQE
jgi:predicted RNA binding protein YcfA (HicA-like mRNA interferase family)